MERTPALDGLRAIAIAMVVAYHADRDLIPGGYLGVTVFFVLSGYLITRTLITRLEREGRVGFGAFYLRRAARLIPALIVFCGVLLALGIAEWSQVSASLGLHANYARVAGLDLGLLTHTWFLAVIAHFYLVWPIVIALTPPRRRMVVIGGLAVAVIAWRVVAIFVMSPAWVYNGTDTNAAALLVGACLATVQPHVRHTVVRQMSRRTMASLAIPLLAIVTFLPVLGTEGLGFLWADFLVMSLAALAVLHALGRPAWMETGVLVWLGKISYGLFLWHYAILSTDLPVLVALVLSVGAAAASWYIVEQPASRFIRGRFTDKEPIPDGTHPINDPADVDDPRTSPLESTPSQSRLSAQTRQL